MRNRGSLLLTGLLWFGLAHHALADDKNVVIYKVRDGQTIYLVAKMNHCSEATITVTGAPKNLVSSVPLPFTVEMAGQKQKVLTVFKPIDPNAPCSCNGEFFWKYGSRLHGEPKPYAYALPYRGSAYRVIQGPHGTFTHLTGSQDEEAIDWAMPAGVKIYPARPGTVVGFRSDCSEGAPDPKLIEDYNYVIIKHDDGTFAEYLHLKKDGVLVHLGDRVTLDQPIALSGNTGFTTEPHLHFAVFYTLDGSRRKTLPVTFKGNNGESFQPEEGKFY